MTVIHILKPGPPHVETLFDSLALVVLLSPLLYYSLFRPLLHEISERGRAEEALRAERNRLETVTESIGAGLAIISREYRTLWANRIIMSTFGNVAGKLCHVSYNRQKDVCFNCGVREVFDAGSDKVVHEQRGTDMNGRTVWSQIIATPIRDEAGSVTAALELVVPITERKLAEEALQAERNKLRGILDAMEDGVCIVNRNYDIEYVNPALEREFGSVADRKCYLYFHGRTEPCATCRNAEVFSGRTLCWEWHCWKNGKTYELLDTPLAGTGGRVAKLEFFHDVTERKRAVEALQESEKQLRRLSLQLLTAQERERRRISRELHDELGQALSLIKLQIRSIENGLPADQSELRDECEHTLQYLDQVIDDVRRLCRELSPAMLDQGLTAALRWLVGTFARTHGLHIVIDAWGLDLDRHFFREDRILVYRIIQEGLTNIGKHAAAKNISIVIGRQDGSIVFLITDDGTGFDPGSESVKDAVDRGLGLSAMEERVRMLGGHFDLWSEKGRGTRITFAIPEERSSRL